MITRRGMFGGALAALALPAVIRTAGLLMPISAPRRLLWFGVDWAAPGGALSVVSMDLGREELLTAIVLSIQHDIANACNIPFSYLWSSDVGLADSRCRKCWLSTCDGNCTVLKFPVEWT